MEHVGDLTIGIGSVLVTSHADSRIRRHGISEDYVDVLLGEADNWKRSGERLTCVTKRDAVFWKLVIERNNIAQVESEWDLVTVYPWEVDTDDALECERWDETDVLNLSFYADGNG